MPTLHVLRTLEAKLDVYLGIDGERPRNRQGTRENQQEWEERQERERAWSLLPLESGVYYRFRYNGSERTMFFICQTQDGYVFSDSSYENILSHLNAGRYNKSNSDTLVVPEYNSMKLIRMTLDVQPKDTKDAQFRKIYNWIHG